ncbi:MAG TPA: DUF2764 family protein [Prolixibacteraceae bacterium]|nr:DUF2764 family protein [Prolixibacteraceae bacterium]
MYTNNYYCLIAGLPDLILNENPKDLTSFQFRLELAEHLALKDHNLLELIYRPYDNNNLLNLLLQKDFQYDILGNYTEDYLKAQIIEPTDIVRYLKLFITDFNSETFDTSPLFLENKLQELFYDYVLNTNNDFIKEWFTFDRNIKNILTAVNCHQYGYSTEKQLIPDHISDGLYESLIRKIPMPELFADEELPYLEQILQIAEMAIDASEKEKATDNIKWSFLDEITVFHYFTIEKILSFVIKLTMVDRWRELDSDTGKKLLKRLISDLEMSYSFAE